MSRSVPLGAARSALAALAVAVAAAAGAVPCGIAGGDPPAAAASEADAALLRRLDAGVGRLDDEGVRAWARETAAEGRARAGSALGGDLLSAAAGALLGRGLDPAVALEHARAAVAAYPRGTPAVGAAWLHAANAFGWLDDPVSALDALDHAEACARGPGPAGDSPRARRAWEEFLGRLGESGPLHRARALTALARHGEAAEVYESLAAERTVGGLHAPDRMWREAALSAWRAGDRARAVRAARRAVDAASTDEAHVERAVWRLLAEHGLLDEAGEMRLENAWPGSAFADDARTTLRGLAGRRGAWRLPLQVAGFAMLAREHDEALAWYEAAFLDPGFADEARASAFYRQTMVTAAHVALQAKRPRDALRWLQAAERYAGGPIPDTTLLRAQIDELYGEVEATPEPPTAPAGPPPASPRAGRAGLGPSPSRRDDAEAPAPADGGPDGRGSLAPLAWVAAAVVLAAAAVAVRQGRRRRRPRS